MRYHFENRIKTPEMYVDADFSQINEHLQGVFKEICSQRKIEKGIYLWGAPGIGKTYAAYAIMNYLTENKLLAKVVPCYKIIESIKETFMGRPTEDNPRYEEINDCFDFLEDLEKFAGLLIIDDIGSVKLTEAPKDALFRIIDERYMWKRPMMFTSNLDSTELFNMVGDRMMSRIMGCCDLCAITGEDKRI